MRLILGTFTALGLAMAAPAAAQSVGMTIVDTAGAPVGTVTAIKGENLQVKTDKHEALLPRSSWWQSARWAAGTRPRRTSSTQSRSASRRGECARRYGPTPRARRWKVQRFLASKGIGSCFGLACPGLLVLRW